MVSIFLPAINSENDPEKIKQQVVREIKVVAPKRGLSSWGTSRTDDDAAPDLRQILSEQLNDEQLREDKNIRKILR